VSGGLECRACHRALKDDVSRQRGYGPVCWRRRNAPTRRRSRRPAPVPHAPDIPPGQDALALFEYQPTLWSL
jgi:hypothetical protein